MWTEENKREADEGAYALLLENNQGCVCESVESHLVTVLCLLLRGERVCVFESVCAYSCFCAGS